MSPHRSAAVPEALQNCRQLAGNGTGSDSVLVKPFSIREWDGTGIDLAPQSVEISAAIQVDSGYSDFEYNAVWRHSQFLKRGRNRFAGTGFARLRIPTTASRLDAAEGDHQAKQCAHVPAESS